MDTRACRSVGIDLGTTYSSLAYIDAHAQPRVVADGSGQTVTPSVIYFDGGEPIVGEIALEHAKLNAENVVQFVKSYMGEPWRRDVGGRSHSPESLSAIILAHLVREAEPQIGPIDSAVITVPAYFAERHRRATQQAGEIAGLHVAGILNEPMSAALAYRLDLEGREQTVVVYDLGGGTFDVTIVRVGPRELVELATYGNRQLGGKDWDQCLIDFVADDFLRAHGDDPRESVQALQDLQIQCERAKRQLGVMNRTTIRLNAFDRNHRLEITRDEFERMTAHLLQATRLTVGMAMEDAGLDWSKVGRVLLVGGSTHMPMVQRMLHDLSGRPADRRVNPVIAVALGAARYAHLLEADDAPEVVHHAPAGARPKATPAPRPGAPQVAPRPATPPPERPRVRFVTAHGVGLQLLDTRGSEVNQVLIPRNHPVPTTSTWRFRTQVNKPNSDRLKLVVTQGDGDDPGLVEVLGKLYLAGIPRHERGGQPVDVTLAFDEQGRLHVNAIYLNTGQSLRQTLVTPNGLREEEVEEFRALLEQTGLGRARRHVPRSLESVILEDGDDDLPLLEPI